ncbi:UxaA family hydrolase [Photobacterium profundum]|nr:altronate dehydratase family protein [Photobacterium profundum]
MKAWIKVNKKDNVIVALKRLHSNTNIVISGRKISLKQEVEKGHKIAVSDIKQGQMLIKYGEYFGHATKNIDAGEWVHSHNVKTNLHNKNNYQYTPVSAAVLNRSLDRNVQIYRRANGDVGVRNELWIIPTVGCVNGIAQMIVKAFMAQYDTSIIDGVHIFTHQFGCSQLGDDHIKTKQLLQNMVTHPNAGGVLVLGLGCENNQITPFKQGLKGIDESRIQFMVAQHHNDEIQAGVDHLASILESMSGDKRVEGKLSELRFGLECGGSDGLSGITANPLLGAFSDTVIANEGTTVLTEVPEMFGAESLLMNRAKNKEVFSKIVDMINVFKDYYLQHNLPIYENPSPGNKAGGISTLEDKSLGCTQKAGTSQIIDILEYTQKISKSGLNLLSAPGNDAIATSALAASGCQLVLFSTGRGTPYGGFVPTVKIATNTDLAKRKPHWIDFNAGVLISEDIDMGSLLNLFLDKVATIASGELTKNEVNDIRELAIWKNGVTL